MSKLMPCLFFALCSYVTVAQEIFRNGDLYGVRYKGVVVYSAEYEEILIKEYFVYGKKNFLWYNLSPNTENAETPYKKFDFDLVYHLLVVGQRADGNLDILDETGEHFYLKNGSYDKLGAFSDSDTYFNNDLLIVKRNGKKGVYNWVTQTEVLPSIYDKVIFHESCDKPGYLIYTQQKHQNTIWDDRGTAVLSFHSSLVDDIYPATICDGYIIRKNFKVGYCRKRSDGSYFLIKPKYDDITFPKKDAAFVITENRGKKGLYYYSKRMLKCRYDEIRLLDKHPYLLAELVVNDKKRLLKMNGELIFAYD